MPLILKITKLIRWVIAGSLAIVQAQSLALNVVAVLGCWLAVVLAWQMVKAIVKYMVEE